MYGRSMSRFAAVSLLAGLFVIVAPVAQAQHGAVQARVASVHASGLDHPDAVLASSLTRSPVRQSIPAARAASFVGVGTPTLWAQAVACVIVPGVALVFTPWRRRAPPRSLFA